MLATQELAPPRRLSGGPADPLVDDLSEVLRVALRTLLDGEGDLPRSARDNSGAALVLLDAGAREGAGLPVVHYHGEKPFFPGRLASLFYLAGIHLRIHRGEVEEDGYVERDILRMIRADDADAANLIFDRITGTLSGPELLEGNLEFFARRRGRLDNLLRSLGVQGTRCEQKIWDRPPFGRDAQFLGPGGARENRATPVAVATLLAKIALGNAGGPEAGRKMLDLLRLDRLDGVSGSLSPPRICAGLPDGACAWGRRAVGARLLHEAAIVELPGGLRYVLAFMSHLGERSESALEPLGRSVAEGLSRPPA